MHFLQKHRVEQASNFFRLYGKQVFGDFRCESSENVAYCYWTDAAIFFPKGCEIGWKNMIREKSLIWLLRKVLTREVRLRIRRFPASAVWLEIGSWRWMGLRPSTPPRLLPENERIASRISWEDVFIKGMSVGIGMISIFDEAGGCLDCRLSSTSGVMLHRMSSDATARTAAGTSLTDWPVDEGVFGYLLLKDADCMKANDSGSGQPLKVRSWT